ncbi:MAG TPA: permease [Candidatus Mediterraneibacter intestinigallinarum]|nr:permease [Candidatus Mediterraneibacter intestinigallinarum]
MAVCSLFVTGAVCVYGIFTSLRPKTPLFYKIVVYGFCSYFLAASYSFLYAELLPEGTGFHAGYFGYEGTFFFLFSSYFGALDRLADGREPEYRIYRIAALLPPVLIVLCGGDLWSRLFLLPVACAAYYACKHLILPDIDMGIIRVMRPYNGVILLFCLVQPFTADFVSGGYSDRFPDIPFTVINLVLVALALPTARRGVQKWFI